MQPLSRVIPQANIYWGNVDTMQSRPKLAIRIAECIAECAEMETMLGIFLAILLNTDSRAALAMYGALENRSAQRRMILAAAESKIDLDHFEILQAVMQTSVNPAMKERDKLAHWCWAYASELPNDLLLSPPDEKMDRHFFAIMGKGRPVKANPRDIYVVTEDYLIKLVGRLRAATEYIGLFAGTVWQDNSQQERDEFRQKLSNEPQIQEALIRLREARKKI